MKPYHLSPTAPSGRCGIRTRTQDLHRHADQTSRELESAVAHGSPGQGRGKSAGLAWEIDIAAD